MAFGELIKSQVLTEYKADTSQMRREIKKLSSEQKKAAKEQLERMEEENRALDDKIETWGKVGLAIGATAGAYMAAADAAEFYQRRTRLAAASSTIDINKLQQASKGLVDQTRLLELSAAAVNGTFKLSQGQLEDVVRGAVALRAEGKDLTHTLERVQQAVTEGTVEPLKELGLIIKGSENDTQQGLNAAIKALREEADKMGGSMNLAGDEFDQASVKLKDSLDEIKEAAGKVAVALTPIVNMIASMANAVVRLGKVISELNENELVKTASRMFSGTGFRGAALAEGARMARNPSAFWSAGDIARGQIPGAGYFGGVASGFAGSLGIFGPGTASNQNAPTGGAGASDPYQFGGRVIRGGIGNGLQISSYGAQSFGGPGGFVTETGARIAGQQGNPELDAYFEAVNKAVALRAQHDKEQSILSQLFGTPAEIDAQAQALAAFGGAVDGFVGAFGAGVDALITGSESFGEAFKKAIGESARGLAVEFAMQSLRHSLFAIGSLAFGNFASAGAHAKAAAGYAVGAGAVGYLARELGAGQTTAKAPTTTGTAGVGSSSGAANGNQGSTTVFLLDDAFTQLPPGQREAMFRKKARRSGMTFEGDAVVNG